MRFSLVKEYAEMNKRTSFVLKLIQSFTTLCDLGDVFSHDSNGVIDLRLDGSCFGVTRGRAV